MLDAIDELESTKISYEKYKVQKEKVDQQLQLQLI